MHPTSDSVIVVGSIYQAAGVGAKLAPTAEGPDKGPAPRRSFVRPCLSAFSSHRWSLKPHRGWIRQK